INQVKKMGFLVKIDTNGSKPDVLHELLESKLIDYVALDFKSMPSHFEKITQTNLFLPFEKSLHLLIESGLSFEVRTTVHSDLISKNDVRMMIDYLENNNYFGAYYLQYFVNNVATLEKLGYSFRELENETLSTKRIKVYFRG
ncbi:MAG TPA: anaerobic ribonucleoside-triphosphate reductase activating protein, partial [Flavobacterium sp.]